jgi:hypothetical protein
MGTRHRSGVGALPQAQNFRGDTMMSLERLASVPILSLIAAAAAAISVTTGLATALGLAAFWTDTILGLVFLSLSAYWALLAVQASKTSVAIGFIAADAHAGSTRPSWRKILPTVAVSAVLMGLGAWYLYEPVAQRLSAHWKLCGSISGACSPAFCVVPLDARMRPIDSECVAPLDASGYVDLTAHDATDYRPRWIRIQCQGKDALIRRVPDSFFAPACNGRIHLP